MTRLNDKCEQLIASFLMLDVEAQRMIALDVSHEFRVNYKRKVTVDVLLGVFRHFNVDVKVEQDYFSLVGNEKLLAAFTRFMAVS